MCGSESGQQVDVVRHATNHERGGSLSAQTAAEVLVNPSPNIWMNAWPSILRAEHEMMVEAGVC